MLIPTTGVPPESPRVRELSQRLQEAIQEFQHRYPMTPAEVRQALWDASRKWRTGFPRNAVARHILFWLVVIGLPVVMAAIIRAFR